MNIEDMSLETIGNFVKRKFGKEIKNNIISDDDEDIIMYSIGDFFKLNNVDGEVFILGATSSETVNLINLENGKRWWDNLKVDDIFNVPKNVLDEHFDSNCLGRIERFKKINNCRIEIDLNEGVNERLLFLYEH